MSGFQEPARQGPPVSLVERYRPRRLDDFIGLEAPKRVLRPFVANPYSAAWLFVGAPGTGKTTMGLALAGELGVDESALHLIPSQECGVERVREVARACGFCPLAGYWHFVLVDEANAMSNAAQLALLSKLDATAHLPRTIFVFTTNGTDRLEPRFLSRCRVLEFHSFGMRDELAELLARVWRAETGRDGGLDFQRIAKDSKINVRSALVELELKILELGTTAP